MHACRCSFENSSAPSIIATRWWNPGLDPVFFCDTELPMFNHDRTQKAVSTTYSRSLDELPDERSAVLSMADDPFFVALREVRGFTVLCVVLCAVITTVWLTDREIQNFWL